MSGPRNPNYLKVVAKTFRVIEAMRVGKLPTRLTDLSQELKLPKATVFRILYTLGELGYVRQDPARGTYELSVDISGFARDEKKEALKRAARPFMERLLTHFEQTVNLGLLDHNQILYLEILEGLRSVRMAATVNTYAPLHATALGKSILAFLERAQAERILEKTTLSKFTPDTIVSIPHLIHQLKVIRRRGFATDNQETEQGARCVAAPIFEVEGKPIAAISVSGPTSHIRGQVISEIAQEIKEACQKVSELIGFRDRPRSNRGVDRI